MTTTLTTSSPSLVVNNHHSHNNNHHLQSTASINNSNNNSNINSNNTTTTNTNNTANGDDSCKKYTLVKWLENSQFDVRNEWLGRLHSVPHANIIDYDADELRPGMEISVFHNNGEIWRAQVIVPKTVNSTTLTSIDLQQQQRFNDKLGNNKNGGSGLQLKQELIHHTLDAVPIHHNHHHHHHHLATFVDLTDFNSAGTGSSSSTTTTSLEDMDTDQVHHHQQSSPSNKSSHTASSGGQLLKNTSTSTPLSNTIMLLTNAPSQGASNSNSSNQNSQNVTIANNLDSNLAKMNKELQFLQTAINEAGLTDLYHSSNAASNAAAATSNGHHHQQQQQQQQITTLMASTAGDMTNIETILAMQCELLEHQKELKQIEYEQIEQLRQLHSNLNRLAKKFDSFETIVSSVNNGSLKLNKSNLNKLNNSIQHIKILDSELSKDLFGTSVTTGGGIGGTSNLNISGNGGTTWSLCSPQQLAGIIQTNTNTATATPILQNLTLLNSAATAQPIELTGNGGNYIITSQLVNPGQKQMNDICFLDPSGTVSNGGQTLKLVGQVDLSSNSASNKPTTLTLLDSAQPQFSELKTVGLLQGADTYLKLNSHTNLNGTANNTTTTNTGLNNENSSTSISEKNKTQGIQTQMALNRFLREAVKQRMGVEFLINNAVSDIPSNVMRQIKKEAFEKYLPNDRRPIKAWGLAMASLRCLKRDLVKNRNKQLANQGGRQQQQPPTNFSNMLTSNAFGLSQVEVVTTTTGGNGGGAENANSSLDHHITATSSPLAPSKPAGRRGGATIRELELNARRF